MVRKAGRGSLLRRLCAGLRGVILTPSVTSIVGSAPLFLVGIVRMAGG